MLRSILVLALLVPALSARGSEAEKAKTTEAEEAPAPTPDEQIAAMEAHCAETADARAARHEETPLYERLGGSGGIHALTREVVRLHMQNEAIRYMFADLDTAKVARRVAEFMISGTGGPPSYEGPDLTTSHKHLKLTNADFLAAGGDVIQAMKNLGLGENEIDEVICALLSMREQVVLPEEPESGTEAVPAKH